MFLELQVGERVHRPCKVSGQSLEYFFVAMRAPGTSRRRPSPSGVFSAGVATSQGDRYRRARAPATAAADAPTQVSGAA